MCDNPLVRAGRVVDDAEHIMPSRRTTRRCAIPLAALALVVAPCTGAAVTFTPVTQTVGISHVQMASSGSQPMTGGAAAGDFDGDGRVDLFFTRADAPAVLYHNTGSGFVDVSTAAGFTSTVATNGVAAGDLDNDGDLDMFVTGGDPSSRHYLYVNNGMGHFTEQALARGADVTAPAGLSRKGQGVALGDYDRDGFLDILTSDHSRPMDSSGARLLRNLGAANPGHFVDMTHAAGIDVYRQPLAVQDTVYRFTPQFSDVDRDGHTDILFAADSRTSQLFWNNGDGTFTDGTLAAHVGTDKSGMGAALGDYDRDGDLDWFITAIMDTPFLGVHPGNRLYRNNGDRTFTDVTTAAGVRDAGWGWGASFLDYDNDGHLDLAATNGFPALGFGADRTKLWHNDGAGSFSDVSTAAGVTDSGQGRSLLRVDYDSDGDEDVVIVNYAAAPIVYRNDGGNEGNWLRIKTVGTISNRDGIGAWITVVPDLSTADQFQVWEVSSGGSYLGQDEMIAHFGLGEFAEPIDRVTIEWPSGVVQRFDNVAVNSLLVANEPLPCDFNADGIVDAADLLAWKGDFGQSAGNLAADDDHDGDVDGADFLAWQRRLGAASRAVGSALAVPESSARTLACVSGVALIVSRRYARRGRRDRRINAVRRKR